MATADRSTSDKDATIAKVAGKLRDCAGKLVAEQLKTSEQRATSAGRSVITLVNLDAVLRHIACAAGHPDDQKHGHENCRETPAARAAEAVYRITVLLREGEPSAQEIGRHIAELADAVTADEPDDVVA